MAGDATFTIKGFEQIRRRFAAMARKVPNVAARALYEEALIEMTESMRRTPVDTGALKASHVTLPPVAEPGGDVVVRILVGGAAAGYAIIVHEDTEVFHKVGQAKFLESTILETAPFLTQRVGKRIKLLELAA